MDAEAERNDAEIGTPRPVTAPSHGAKTRQEIPPRRQQDERVRYAAVMKEILDGPDVTDDEIQVGRSRRQETDDQTPPERQRLVVGLPRRRRPRQQRAGKRMRSVSMLLISVTGKACVNRSPALHCYIRVYLRFHCCSS